MTAPVENRGKSESILYATLYPSERFAFRWPKRQLIVRGKVTRHCPQATAFEEWKAKMELNQGPSACQPNAC